MQPKAFIEFVHSLGVLTKEQSSVLEKLAEELAPPHLAKIHDEIMELAAPLEKNEAGQMHVLERGSLMLDQILQDISPQT